MPIKIPDVGRLNDVGATSMRQSLGVAQQSFAALQGLSGAVQQAGSKMAKASLQIAEADNVKKISEAELTAHEVSSAYLQSLEGDFNEDQWIPGAQEAYKEIRQTVNAQNLSPAAKKKLDMRMDRLESNFLLRVGQLAATQISSRAKEAGMLSAEVAISNQDPQGYADAIGDMVSAGVISPEQGKSMEMEGGPKIRTTQLQELLLVNHKEAKAQIEAGEWDDLPPSTRAAALSKAVVEDNKEKREFYNDMGLALEQGEKFSEDQIMQWKNNGMMDAGDAATFIRAANRKNPPPFDSALYVELNKKLSDYRANLDDTAQSGLTELTKRIANSGFTGTNMTKLRSRLDRLIRGTGSAPARVRSEMMDVLSFYSDKGSFGLRRDDEGKAIPESVQTSKDLEVTVIDELDTWLDAHPDAGHEEAREAAKQIIQPFVDVGGADDILDVDLSDLPPGLSDVGITDSLPQFDDITENTLDTQLFD